MDWLNAIIDWDRAATLWINAQGGGSADTFWAFMSFIKIWIPMYIAVAAVMIWRLGWKKGLVAIAVLLLAFALSDQLNNLIKYLVQRVRPCNDEGMIAAGLHILETGGGWSFPSGHANNCFAFAVGSALCFKAEVLGLGKPDTSSSLRRKRVSAGVKRWVRCYGLFIISWAVLVSVSRVMVGRHFLLDIAAGALIGIAIGIASGKTVQRILKKIS